ncbi:MAG TPA: hypothetical protein VGW11_02320 [Solirubrobacteraceae bacterium]|nr:hypothetical protein [Solirubrobacteraceae bacterium]
MPRALRLLLLFALVLAAAATLAACGEDEDVQAILEETFAGEDKEVESGRLVLGLRITPSGGTPATGPIAARLEGPFEGSEDEGGVPAFDLDLSLNAGPQTFTAGVVSTGEAGFVRFQGGTFRLPDQIFAQFRQGYLQSRKQGEQGSGGPQSFASLGVDPRGWLRDPRIVGEEEVGGADTTHIRAGIDVARLLEDINRLLSQAGALGVTKPGQKPQQITEVQRRLITQAVRSAQMDLWTGEDDRILRQLRLSVDYAIPEQAREKAQGLTSGQLALQITIADLGDDQEIEAPEGARPLEELLGQLGLGQLGGQLPGAGGGATQGGKAPEGKAPEGEGRGSSGAATEYEQCLEQAGRDVGAIQKCAELLRAP